MQKTPAKRKTKKDLFYNEAQSLYTAGWKLEKISETLSVSLPTLRKWQAFGHWDRKRELVTEHPKLMGEALRGLVKQKVKNLLSNQEEINICNIEELSKIIGLIERLEEQAWDERAAVVEVMSLFGNFVRRQVEEQQEMKLLVTLMKKFFEEMEGS